MAGLILASASPQRRAILEQAGIRFTVRPADVEEETAGDPLAVAEENARRKAATVAGWLAAEAAGDAGAASAGSLVLGADTLVAIGGDILGKPRDEAQAREYVARLAGATHEVVGGIALAEAGRGGGPVTAVVVTTVRFRAAHAALLDWYVGTGEWRGRAGGYAIQGAGAVLVDGIEGDYLNIVGLPLARLLTLRPDLLPA
ncbi:Maf family protein [Candidatus Solirubrobacter pratensis]|uniref:Maf family protein n=1 Tax=Candidatus Solirubrobacter pratensis TaxID=1298857 RepID=UPI000421DB4E|nr:Maf family protein [Candidatus Solirubrobacter pratensis]